MKENKRLVYYQYRRKIVKLAHFNKNAVFKSFKMIAKGSLVLVLFYVCIVLSLPWLQSCFPALTLLIAWLASHFDLTTFMTVETFILSNLSTFTSTYEFLASRLHKQFLHRKRCNNRERSPDKRWSTSGHIPNFKRGIRLRRRNKGVSKQLRKR
jgi:hypothetical protein